jgi:hypothetical protein
VVLVTCAAGHSELLRPMPDTLERNCLALLNWRKSEAKFVAYGSERSKHATARLDLGISLRLRDRLPKKQDAPFPPRKWTPIAAS